MDLDLYQFQNMMLGPWANLAHCANYFTLFFIFSIAILAVDDSIVDLETLEALYENVSIKTLTSAWLVCTHIYFGFMSYLLLYKYYLSSVKMLACCNLFCVSATWLLNCSNIVQTYCVDQCMLLVSFAELLPHLSNVYLIRNVRHLFLKRTIK